MEMRNGGLGWNGYYISAYGIAVKHGFQGTEAEWLDALKGADIEMRYSGEGVIQWKNDEEMEWHNLVDFSLLLQRFESNVDLAKAAADEANAAKDLANASAANANQKATDAEKSAGDAAAAAEQADTAAANANQKAQLAEEKAGLADQAARNAAEKAQAAEAATGSATKAATEANTARDAANTAAQEASTSKEAADDAAGSANKAAQAADIAALNAGNAATEANAAKENAQTQANYAQEQGNRAKTIMDELENTDIGGLAAGIVELRNGKQDKSTAAKHTFRTVIGTSAAGWTADECDYLCDGTDDQVEINAAIQALPAEGGEIHFLDGTYNITGQIKVDRPHTALSGNSGLAVLKRMYNSTLGGNDDMYSLVTGFIAVTAEACSIQGFTIDGNQSQYTGTYNTGIILENAGPAFISRNRFQENKEFGICATRNCWEISICDNDFSGSYKGIVIRDTDRCIIKRNIFTARQVGLNVENAAHNVIAANIFNTLNRGIVLNLADYNAIQGNKFLNFRTAAIRLEGSSGNILTVNSCILGTSYTSSMHNIHLTSATDDNGASVASERNLVADNLILGKDYVCDGGMDNTFVNNKFE